MKIHHLRSATFIIESGNNFILVDPMLGDVATQPYYTFFRFKARKKNPLVPMPANSKELLQKVTHCLITHKHLDHIDKEGTRFLLNRDIPVLCSTFDKEHFIKQGLNIIQTIDYWEKKSFVGGYVTGIPARHGYGYVAKSMGNVMGFHFELPDEPSVYISSDTIYTNEVDKALKDLHPDIAVVACGSARLDFGKPILMRMNDIIKFVENSPNKVVANHLEALNHCPTTRAQLKKALSENGLLEKVYIPDDGDTIEIAV